MISKSYFPARLNTVFYSLVRGLSGEEYSFFMIAGLPLVAWRMRIVEAS